MQASLLAAASGFDALFFARVDYRDAALRRAIGASELVWAPARPFFGADGDVFSGTFPNHYGPPAGFNFEWGQTDPPVQVRNLAVVFSKHFGGFWSLADQTDTSEGGQRTGSMAASR